MKQLTLVDGNSLLFRAYYATAYPGAKLLQTSSGQHTNAIFAFSGMLEKVIEQTDSHMLIAFDTGAPTKRHLMYKEYKAGRSPMPEELGSQIPLIHELIKYLGIKEYSIEGYEADDIIGTLAKEASKKGIKVNVYSSDRDLLQLIDDNITIHILKKGMSVVDAFDPAFLKEEYGLTEHQFLDFKALMGDPSDNIPGIPGVGIKTAIKLLQEYGSLEEVLNNKDNIKGKLGENIRNNVKEVLFSKELSKIDTEMELPFGLKDTLVKELDEEKLIDFYQRLELKQLVIKHRKNQDNSLEQINEDFNYKVLETEEEIKSVLNQNFSIYFEFSDSNYHKAELWGIGLSNGKKHYFIDAETSLKSIALNDYLSTTKYDKYTYNYKAAKVFLMWNQKQFKGVVYDLLLATYILKSSIGKEDFTSIAQNFDVNDLSYDEEIYGKGARKGLPLIPSDYENHIAKKAYTINRLMDSTMKTIKEQDQLHLLNKVELPLSDVLAEMEFEGLLVNQDELNSQKTNFKIRIDELNAKIRELAGVEFNVDSPKQLGEVLFETMGLPNGKKTKTGFSTNIDVLNNLIDRHEIIPLIIEYRQLTKLYSTYIIGIEDTLFSDGKVHTIFNQALTLTGRLSSLEPNLQNIPVRSKEGREIRKLFVAGKNNYLLGADYSQIELRVLAHIADAKALKEAFANNIDIHTSTAQNVFHVDVVDDEQRRRAKAVNFGIIYGIGAWSLSEDINVTVKEAETFIEKYLDVYPEIGKYMTDIVEFAKKNGYVETLLNRRRYIPELTSKVYHLREFGKRTALNAPIQGSAADIIKLAMISLSNYLLENNKKSKLILQVHDELILEVPKEELDEMEKMVPKIMEEAYDLTVSLKSSCDIGKTWYDLN